jgi:hypothetical protein
LRQLRNKAANKGQARHACLLTTGNAGWCAAQFAAFACSRPAFLWGTHWPHCVYRGTVGGLQRTGP